MIGLIYLKELITKPKSHAGVCFLSAGTFLR